MNSFQCQTLTLPQFWMKTLRRALIHVLQVRRCQSQTVHRLSHMLLVYVLTHTPCGQNHLTNKPSDILAILSTHCMMTLSPDSKHNLLLYDVSNPIAIRPKLTQWKTGVPSEMILSEWTLVRLDPGCSTTKLKAKCSEPWLKCHTRWSMTTITQCLSKLSSLSQYHMTQWEHLTNLHHWRKVLLTLKTRSLTTTPTNIDEHPLGERF